jgi:hypothetical protein
LKVLEIFYIYVSIFKFPQFILFLKKFPAVYTGESESEKEADHPSAEGTQLDKSENALPVPCRKNAVAKLFSPERQLPEWTKFGTE